MQALPLRRVRLACASHSAPAAVLVAGTLAARHLPPSPISVDPPLPDYGAANLIRLLKPKEYKNALKGAYSGLEATTPVRLNYSNSSRQGMDALDPEFPYWFYFMDLVPNPHSYLLPFHCVDTIKVPTSSYFHENSFVSNESSCHQSSRRNWTSDRMRLRGSFSQINR